MERNQESDEAARRDHHRARREQDAGEVLRRLGAETLAARPWRPPPAPPSAVDLAHFALWRAGNLDPSGVLSALTLLPAARAEIDGLEAGLLFTARSAGLTWAQIAEAMGFNSPQACQQYFNRLAGRQSADS
ncbi:SANT/Myb-like DNA-binding domain-containing protein [Nakamurella lactea]|uniref:hypothetical protein n=1 Tax=Nakamurella lactea TaxID=459515 RepID=UPI00048E2B2D|nr:hypothetical protein [Nakamurella lactea]